MICLLISDSFSKGIELELIENSKTTTNETEEKLEEKFDVELEPLLEHSNSSKVLITNQQESSTSLNTGYFNIKGNRYPNTNIL